MAKCIRDRCDGTIDQGFCDTCGMAPAAAQAAKVTQVAPAAGAAAPAPPAAATSPGTTAPGTTAPGTGTSTTASSTTRPPRSQRVITSVSPLSGVTHSGSVATASTTTGSTSSSTTSTTGSSRGFSRGLVDVPDVALVDPSTLTIADPTVAEKDRFCANCGEAVGRAKAGREGRLQGFCSACRQPFDLAPKLAPGEVVAGQYEVVGCLAHGGFGWIYLAKDRNVSNRWVVLKGLLDSGNADGRAAALAERQFLATMEHPSIVKIYNFVAHNTSEYIVMEFVGGKSLKTILKDRRELNGGTNNPLPLDVAITYILGILPALSYLHERGYVFCDFKPDNMIHQGNQLKLIDLGGVWRLGDSDGNVYGTVGFQAPEIATVGPSISSDTYTIVRTLAVLSIDFPGYTTTLKHDLPDPATAPILHEFKSFYRLLQRGTADEPAERFQSVDELSEQLLGVLREVVAVRTNTPKPFPSTLFTSDLLAARTTGQTPEYNWHSLPLPLLVPTDPAASYLANLTATAEQIPALIHSAISSGQVPDSIETRLRRVRAHLEIDRIPNAMAALTEAKSIDPTDWRIRWYEGLVALATNFFSEAIECFEAVATFWPGEIAPRIALAHAFEVSGAHASAHSIYLDVVEIDPSYDFAVFGLGRCLLATGNRTEAARSYARISPTSALRSEAQAQQALALLGDGAAPPNQDDLIKAASVVTEANLPASRSAEIRRQVLTNALTSIKKSAPSVATKLFEQPFNESSVRKQLEATYRDLSELETDRRRRIALIDQANRVRPWTLF
jgi:serine/threonine-protein kinase PknG